MTALHTRIDRLLQALPQRHRGPGGALAIVQRGEVLARHAWGYANAERRIPFTPATLHRMCSVTKQFTCAALLDAFPDPSALDSDIRARLPLLQGPAPTALHLAHNQSGLRDYWAVAMLHGAPAESPFGDTEAARVIADTRTLQFEPGTSYSYVNQNFRLLSDILQARTGRPFAALLARIFDRAGMATALLAADTRAMPDGTEGYEGTQATGFRPARNRILWTGDAGLGASLDDMIAWEQHIDATRHDPASLHARLSTPVTFANGAPAPYGFGLARRNELGRPAIGHGGALRGWRSHRVYLPAERLSAVVLFNHMADAHEAAVDALAAVLDHTPAPTPAAPMPPWLGAYLEPETGLSARFEPAGTAIRLRYAQGPELLDIQPGGAAQTSSGTRIDPAPDGTLWMTRPQENRRTRLIPCPSGPTTGIAGRYRNAELDSTLLITSEAGVLYGGFSGFLGQGRMELLDPIGADTWALPCPRALDHTPPGDWTLTLRRDATGRAAGIRVGCWLARDLDYPADP